MSDERTEFERSEERKTTALRSPHAGQICAMHCAVCLQKCV